MENASKALIIAGAILLSILIIGLGVFIFNQANSSMKNINLSQNEVQNFNEPFLQYAGENITGTNVMALCDKVKAQKIKQEWFTFVHRKLKIQKLLMMMMENYRSQQQ